MAELFWQLRRPLAAEGSAISAGDYAAAGVGVAALAIALGAVAVM